MRSLGRVRWGWLVCLMALLWLVGGRPGCAAGTGEEGWHGTLVQGGVEVRLDATCGLDDRVHPVHLRVKGLEAKAEYAFYLINGNHELQTLKAASHVAKADERGQLEYVAQIRRCPRGKELHLRIRRVVDGVPAKAIFDGYFAESEF